MASPHVQTAFRPDLAVRLICPDCRDPVPNIHEKYDSGDLVCADCGLILGDRIVDTRSEWRTFADSDGPDPSRVGAADDPILGALNMLGTSISSKDNRTGMARELQRTQGRTQGSGITTLTEAFRAIGEICDSMSLPKSIADAARILFKRVHDEKLLRGKSKPGICATCVYAAARQGRVARTLKEIEEITLVNKKLLAKCFKVMNLAFNLGSTGSGGLEGTQLASMADRELAFVTTDASDILSRYCSHLDMPRPQVHATIQLALAVRESGILTGRQPNTVAGACIMFATTALGVPKGARELAPIAGVSEGTIQQAYRLLLPHRLSLLSNVTAFKDGRMDVNRLPSLVKAEESGGSNASTPNEGTVSP